jgi:hypothetical protein
VLRNSVKNTACNLFKKFLQKAALAAFFVNSSLSGYNQVTMADKIQPLSKKRLIHGI